jgi:hypothetical protein
MRGSSSIEAGLLHILSNKIEKNETTPNAAGGGEAKAIATKILKDKKLL